MKNTQTLMPNLTKKIQNLAHQNNLWQKGDKIIIGISGGADSVCLFRILLSLAPKHNFSLHLAHVNHGFVITSYSIHYTKLYDAA